MKELILEGHLSAEVAAIYAAMENEYNVVAGKLDFSCTGCQDNCCDSYFQHHTYTEWAYLFQGVRELGAEKQQEIMKRARDYIGFCEEAEAEGKRPQVMCPLNEEGLCILYKHRLMVCRTHGIPASMRRPDGRILRFPGCFRCQEIVKSNFVDDAKAPHMERTPLLQRLVAVERGLIGDKIHLVPRVKLTIAQMLVLGPPAIPVSHCERRGRWSDV